MTVEIKVPALGESVTEATIARWLKQPGEAVARDEPLVELETDKVTLEVNAPAAGKLEAIAADAGATVAVGAVLGTLADGAVADASKPAAKPESKPAPPATPVMPAARKLAADQGIDTAAIGGTGKGGRVTKQDVQAAIRTEPAPKPQPPVKEPEPPPAPVREPEPKREPPPSPPPGERADGERPRADREERVRMTRLRRTIAARLKQAQNTAAMLTTFNEVDMTALMALRQGYRESFEKKHGVRLGYMSFFVKACITALREIPAVNGEVDGEDIVYKNYYDIGVAVGTQQGLVVPVVRDADTMSFADLEKRIAELGTKARDGKLALSDLTGGTFSISNGGVYGSLLSTPILNPPQSAILGMHKIQERPVAIAGKVEVRPMMYLALSYDHRIVDGREAVTFLVRVKECLEDPQRILLDV